MAKIIPFISRLDRDNLTEEEKALVADLDRMTDDEIIEKYDDITYRGKILTQDEKKTFISVIRALRKEKAERE